MPAPDGTLPDASPSEPPSGGGDANPGANPGARSGAIGNQTSIFDPTTVIKLPTDITGSISRKPQAPRSATPVAAPVNPAVASLPVSFGPVLRAAAVSNDPAAYYEVAVRYADGRGVPPSLDEAARWFERAAKTGFAPAEFRLASLYERGEGVKKDLGAARKFYMAAAEQGHAKSMHNLAVLNAEGDSKPVLDRRRVVSQGVADIANRPFSI